MKREIIIMKGSVMVIGGGIAGIQASLDLTELGFKVHLIEREPSIGGSMAQFRKDRLSSTREKMGLSCQKLAELVGVDRMTIYRWEKGIISFK